MWHRDHNAGTKTFYHVLTGEGFTVAKYNYSLSFPMADCFIL